LLALGIGVVTLGLGVLALGNALESGIFNIFDDDSAYIYFARRLLATGGLVDPFNFRRLTGYGGSSLYQSLFYQLSGSSSLRGFEFAFASLLLVAVTVGTMRRRWLIPGTILVGSAIVLGFGLGPVSNLSPECSVAALSLGVFQLLTRVRRGAHPLLYVSIGMLVGAIASLRVTYLVSVGLAGVLVVVCVYGWRAIRPLAMAGLVAAVCCVGWSLALYRSSGTLLYPLFAGNANPTWPSGGDPAISGLTEHLRLFVHAFSNSAIGFVALVAVVVAVVLLVAGGPPGPLLALLAAGFGTLVQLLVFTYAFSALTLTGIVRYEAPSTLATGLLAIGLFWPERALARPPDRSLRPARLARLPMWAGSVSAVVFPVALVALIADVSPVAYAHSANRDARLGGSALVSSKGPPDRYVYDRREYRQINADIPPGSTVLAAVDYPALLDPTRYRFATLDIAGAVSPAPHMPFFQGAAAKVGYLQRAGYQYIVADSPMVHGLYWEGFYTRLAIYLTDFHDRAWAPYMIDWQRSVSALEFSGTYRTWKAGSLTLIRIGP
jgi:hypothetical protein